MSLPMAGGPEFRYLGGVRQPALAASEKNSTIQQPAASASSGADPSSARPRVTLAVPTRNRAHFLRHIVQDILDQDYENLEILISDNASSDGTRELVETMANVNPRIRYRRNIAAVPIITHFNQCLDAARGEFFAMVCDDDRINRSFVRGLANALAESPRATVAVPVNAIINDAGDLVRTLPLPDKLHFDGFEFVTRWLWKIEELPVANLLTIMARTATMRKLRYQPFEKGLNSDNLLFLRLALSGEVRFCQEAVFYWRDHASQQGRSASARAIARSGHQFLRFVRESPAREFIRQSPNQRKLIENGVRRMNAEALLHGTGFFEHPLRPAAIAGILAAMPDAALARLVLRHCYQQLRRRIFFHRRDMTAPAKLSRPDRIRSK